MTHLQPRPKRQQVRKTLREMILDGCCAPGSRLVQQELADGLGASVSMVREVLLELVSVGLVRAEENLGFFVCKLDMRRVTEAYQVRAVHDGLAARLCCQRSSRQDIAWLKKIVERSHELRCSDNKDEVIESVQLDRQLHERIVKIAGSEALRLARQSCRVPVVAVDNIPEGRRKATYQEHLNIIESIEQNRSEEAEQLMREHVTSALHHIEKMAEAEDVELKWYV